MPRYLSSVSTNPILRDGISTYFLSKASVTAALHYLLALSTVLFVIWPKSQYLRIGSPPLTFSILAIVATLIMAYFSFSYGAAGPVQEPDQPLRAWLIEQHLPPRRAVSGLTLLAVIHTVFLLLLALPLLFAASHVSGVSAQGFGRALALILVCTLAYRWLGMLMLCLWDRQEFLRYVVARVAFVLFVIGSAFFLPPLNPLLGLISMSFGDELGQIVTIHGWLVPYADVALTIHLLILLAVYIMVSMLVARSLSSTRL